MVAHGHRVLVQRAAGAGSGLLDAQYRDAGAQVVSSAREVWQRAEMIVKVKEPLPEEYPQLRPGQILFTYLHLAPEPELTKSLLAAKVTGIAYETMQEKDG